MEVMEEGNLMDRVRILLQRDMAYYQERQSVLHETLCSGVVGGLLDFPHYASFAAYKLVLWWEEEYQAAFRKPSGGREVALSDPSLDRGCGGVAKTSAPKEFVQLTAESGSQLLEHLHALSQEALDHADLTVLAATLGAAALLRSCLWCYHQLLLKARQSDGGSGVPDLKKISSSAFGESQKERRKPSLVYLCCTELAQAEELVTVALTKSLSLHASQKQFHSMAEALAERLLDLHCRLLSLYVLQDSDCLNWENPRAFFEGERGSVTVQMWWLYMQGTRTDLWNTVPPRTAQRVFAGMLNETLTILTVRYATAEPSAARSDLLVTDLSNMLLCTRELAVSVCADAAELVGLSQRTKITRDVHAKCHELLTTLLLRGCPLDALYRVFRRGLSNVGIFSPLERAPAPWVQLVSPQFFRGSPRTYSDLEDGAAISLELSVLLAQPQPSWPLLLRVLMMRNCRVATLLLNHLIAGEPEPDPVPSAATTAKPVPETGAAGSSGGCGRFLCCGDCSVAGRVTASQVEAALVHVVATVGGAKALTVTLLPTLQATGNTRWGHTLDRGQVWNQKRPPWANAIISPLQPMLQATVETLAAAVQDGAAVQDLLQLALSCLVQLAPCVPPWLNAASRALGEQLPADVHPLGESPLLQVVVSALYAGLVASGSDAVSELAEALCRLDDDPLLRPSIQEFLRAVDDYTEDIAWEWRAVEESLPTAELLVSKILLTTTGRQALKVLDQHIHEKAHWVLAAVGREGDCLVLPPRPLLHTMFHIGSRQFDQYLAGSWSPDWAALLRSPLGLSREKVWTQLKRRSEFSDYVSDPDQLSQHDTIVVRTLIDLFSRHEESAAPKVTSTVSKSVSDNSKALTTTIKSKVAEAEAEPSPVQESQTHGERDSRGATDPHPPTASSESSDKTRADSKTEESGSTDTLKKVDFVPDLENGPVNEQNNPSTKRKVKGSSVKSSSQSASASSLKSPSKDSNEEQKSSTTKTPSKAKE